MADAIHSIASELGYIYRRKVKSLPEEYDEVASCFRDLLQVLGSRCRPVPDEPLRENIDRAPPRTNQLLGLLVGLAAPDVVSAPVTPPSVARSRSPRGSPHKLCLQRPAAPPSDKRDSSCHLVTRCSSTLQHPGRARARRRRQQEVCKRLWQKYNTQADLQPPAPDGPRAELLALREAISVSLDARLAVAHQEMAAEARGAVDSALAGVPSSLVGGRGSLPHAVLPLPDGADLRRDPDDEYHEMFPEQLYIDHPALADVDRDGAVGSAVTTTSRRRRA